MKDPQIIRLNTFPISPPTNVFHSMSEDVIAANLHASSDALLKKVVAISLVKSIIGLERAKIPLLNSLMLRGHSNNT